MSSGGNAATLVADKPLELRFSVKGKPQPKERPRHVQRGARMFWITPNTTLKYERHVGQSAQYALLARQATGEWPDPEGCARVQSKRMRGTTKGIKCKCGWCATQWLVAAAWYLPDARTRDTDNLEKSLKDGLNHVLWWDDKQAIVDRKSRHIDRKRPRVDVHVRRLIGEMEPAC